MTNLNMYRGKKVLVTGHTGFKGAWLSIWLKEIGAEVIGYSLSEWNNEEVYNNSKLKEKITDVRGDINNLDELKTIFEKYQPEIVFHLAAQPLVRESYDNPVLTFRTNVIGTMNILECIKNYDFVKAGVMITTDKCYKNKESEEGYHEDDELGGSDPYSASKSCAEIVIESYRRSFFSKQNKFVASARAGNVIGGGDFAKDRLIPDCINSLNKGEKIKIRNPKHKRPWQHVLEPLYGYLLIGEKMLEGRKDFCEAWNLGPEKDSIITVQELVEKMIYYWKEGQWEDLSKENETKYETKILNLKIDKAKKRLNWKPKWDINKTVEKTIEGYKSEDMYKTCKNQIKEYQKE